MIFVGVTIVRFAICQRHISAYGDIHHKSVTTGEAVCIKLAIIALINLGVFSPVIIVSFLIFLRRRTMLDQLLPILDI